MVTTVWTASPDEAALDEKRLEDESYLKSYFNRIESDARSPSKNPVVFVQAMTAHLKKVFVDLHPPPPPKPFSP